MDRDSGLNIPTTRFFRFFLFFVMIYAWFCCDFLEVVKIKQKNWKNQDRENEM